tara:strand:- start:246 stop:635 length:390 start_codon:yes stop_codon:yes gene_type:complete
MTETNNQGKIQIKDAENQKIAGMSEDELLIELSKNPVQYTNIDEDKLAARKAGEDFEGTLREFDRLFQWIFLGPDHQVLVEAANQEKFTGLIHIKDKTLDEKTYPNHEQIIKFKDGEITTVDGEEQKSK